MGQEAQCHQGVGPLGTKPRSVPRRRRSIDNSSATGAWRATFRCESAQFVEFLKRKGRFPRNGGCPDLQLLLTEGYHTKV
jgi:hypothetical protein